MLREAGIVFRGCILSSFQLNEYSNKHDEKDLTFLKGTFFSIITGLSVHIFAEKIEYLECTSLITSFFIGKINSNDNKYLENIIAYAVFDKDKNPDKLIKKRIKPNLNKMLNAFKIEYDDKNLSTLNQFKHFNDNIYEIMYS